MTAVRRSMILLAAGTAMLAAILLGSGPAPAAAVPSAGQAATTPGYAATTRLISGDARGRAVTPPGNPTIWALDTGVSANGRWVVFASPAAIVPGTTAGEVQVYLRDVRAGRTTKLSTRSPARGLDGLLDVSISASGRYVAWAGEADAVLLDRRTGSRTAIGRAGSSVRAVDVAGTREGYVSVTADGAPLASGTPPAHDPRQANSYLYDIGRARYTFAVPALPGRDIGDYSAVLTPDQRNVLALTTTGLVADGHGGGLFVRSVAGTTWKRLRRPPVAGVHDLGAPSADGRYLAITTTKALVKADRNRVGDVYRWDTRTGAAVLVSVTDSEKPCVPGTRAPAEGPAGSYGARISADARIVAFDTTCANFVAGAQVALAVRDLVRRTTHKANLLPVKGTSTGLVNSWGLTYPFDLSADGRWISWLDEDARLVGKRPATMRAPETFLRGPLR